MRKLIEQALREVVPATDDLIVVHSSLIHLGLADPRLKWNVLGSLKSLADRGVTIAVPTFTFSFCRGEPFDLMRSRSETGVVGDWVRESGDAIRTPHPIYSFAVMGPRRSEIADCANSSTFGDDLVFALFEKLNGRLVMLGCDWSYCTQFHRYEEEAQVPYRHYKTFRGPANLGLGPVATEARMFVRDLDVKAQNDFAPVMQRVRDAGAVLSCTLGHGRVESAPIRAVASVARELIATDPCALVSNGPRVARDIQYAKAKKKNPPLRIAVLSDGNVDLLQEMIAHETSEYIRDRRVEMARVPFGQSRQQILDVQSDLNKSRPELAFFINRPQDVLRVPSLDMPLEQQSAFGRVDEYADLIGRLAGGGTKHVFVMGLNLGAPSSAAPLRNAVPLAGHLLAAADQRLRERLAEWPQVYVFDPGSIVNSGPIFDDRLWLLGRMPFADGFSRAIARRCCGLALAALERTVRLLVLDLDNTLWGGVLGEDRMEGLALGGDFPGNAYSAFQAELVRLSRRGVALAICSKNDEADVLQAIRGLDAMVIKEDDLAAWRINWQPKWFNIQEIATDLNLGLESVGFIDDNPLECELVGANLPDVRVLSLPRDPAAFVGALLSWPPLTAIEVTKEDHKRARSYTVARKSREERAAFANPVDFLMSLDSRLHIAKLGPANQARCVQLLNKTNQFNTTTRRYGAPELKAIEAEGGLVAILGLEDKHTELENIGVVIVRWDHPQVGAAYVDDFLLSCRVLGRGIETATLAWIANEARRRGMKYLLGPVTETERNTPVRGVFSDHGFIPTDEPGMWRLDLASQSSLRPPSWLKLVDKLTGEIFA